MSAGTSSTSAGGVTSTSTDDTSSPARPAGARGGEPFCCHAEDSTAHVQAGAMNKPELSHHCPPQSVYITP
jgi:hypothetical protein